MPEDYEVVYHAKGQLDTNMICAFLESNGISALAYGESVGATYGLTVAPLGEVDILVPAAQAEEARQILIDMEAGKYELPPSVDLSAGENPEEEEGAADAQD